MSTRTTARVRLSRTFLSHLDGSGFMQCPASRRDDGDCSQGCEPSDHDLARRISAAPTRRDGARSVDVDAVDLAGLYSHADLLQICAADNIGWDFAENIGDLNAGRGFMRQAERIAAERGWRL